MIDHSVSRVVERRLAFGKEDKEELRTSAARLEGIELARRFGMIEVKR